MHVPEADFKKFLIDQGYLAEEEFDSADSEAKENKTDLDAVFIQRGFFSEDALARILAEYFKVPYIDLKRQKINLEDLKSLPEEIARARKAVVFKKDDKGFHVAVVDPGDLDTLQFLASRLGGDIVQYVTSREGLREAMVRYKATIGEDFANVIETTIKQTQKIRGSLDEVARDLPIVQMFDTITQYAVAERASDIHVEPLKDNVLIRFRIDGVMTEVIRLPKALLFPLIARIKILSNLRVDEHLVPQDGRFKVEIGDLAVAVRVSVVPTYHGEKAVLRLLIEEERYYSLDALGMSAAQAELLRSHFVKPHGMILVTGPTGSGKTTTLYTIMRIRNTPDVNVTTIEDPIEYDIQGINQIQVNTATNMTFAEGLRSILRQSPDIVMVGEIRDKETAQLAINAALTGHLLLSTLHTNDAIGAAPRLLDLGIEPFLLASTLNLSMAQRLVRKICIDCIVSVRLTNEEFEAIKKRIAKSAPWAVDLVPQEVFRGRGCNICGGSGFRGRLGIFEFLEIDEKIRLLIAKNATGDEIKDVARKGGMKSMLEDGLTKVQSGITTIEEVLRAVEE